MTFHLGSALDDNWGLFHLVTAIIYSNIHKRRRRGLLSWMLSNSLSGFLVTICILKCLFLILLGLGSQILRPVLRERCLMLRWHCLLLQSVLSYLHLRRTHGKRLIRFHSCRLHSYLRVVNAAAVTLDFWDQRNVVKSVVVIDYLFVDFLIGFNLCLLLLLGLIAIVFVQFMQLSNEFKLTLL